MTNRRVTPVELPAVKRAGVYEIAPADLARYRRQREKLVKRVSEARIPTEWGDFTCYAYESVLDGEQHIAMVKGTVAGEPDDPVQLTVARGQDDMRARVCQRLGRRGRLRAPGRLADAAGMASIRPMAIESLHRRWRRRSRAS